MNGGGLSAPFSVPSYRRVLCGLGGLGRRAGIDSRAMRSTCAATFAIRAEMPKQYMREFMTQDAEAALAIQTMLMAIRIFPSPPPWTTVAKPACVEDRHLKSTLIRCPLAFSTARDNHSFCHSAALVEFGTGRPGCRS